MDISALIRVGKQQVKLATRGLDPDGLIALYLDEIPIRVSRRAARTRMGCYMSHGEGAIGYITINLSMCPDEVRFMGTLIHELAHAVNHWVHQSSADVHGPLWQSIMMQLGQPTERCVEDRPQKYQGVKSREVK